MMRILMTLALCSIASAPRADSQLSPWVFDLQKQFTTCINSADDPYTACHDRLAADYTLRREIAYALDVCLAVDTAGCISAFNDAGLPADRLNIANLPPCTMLPPLNEVDTPYISENACIEQIAQNVAQNSIPTSHNTKISCSINYVECLEIGSLSGKYWKSALSIQHLDQLQAMLKSADLTNDPTTSHRYFSLLERQHRLQIDLAETTCNIQTVMPHRSNTRDYEACLGQAYADLWLAPKHDITD